MSFEPKTDWKDGEVLPASDMNRIEQGIADASNVPDVTEKTNGLMLATDKVRLDRLSSETTHMIYFPDGGSVNATGAICREGDVAQLNMTFISTQESTVLFEMPVGFHPAMNFDAPVIDSNGAGIVALLSYDRVTNMVSIHHSPTSPISKSSKATIVYVCDE